MESKRAFDTTVWSQVLRAGAGESCEAAKALNSLCRRYWQPVYTYCRQRGCGREDAQDITQAYFARLVEKKPHLSADPRRGRFRTFLLADFKRFLSTWRRDAGRLKRGGGARWIVINHLEAEERMELELTETDDPEKIFHRSWANVLLERAAGKLKREYCRRGMGDQFELLRVCVEDRHSAPAYSDLAVQLGMSVSGVKSAVARLRARFRHLYRGEISELVENESQVDDEIRALLRAA